MADQLSREEMLKTFSEYALPMINMLLQHGTTPQEKKDLLNEIVAAQIYKGGANYGKTLEQVAAAAATPAAPAQPAAPVAETAATGTAATLAGGGAAQLQEASLGNQEGVTPPDPVPPATPAVTKEKTAPPPPVPETPVAKEAVIQVGFVSNEQVGIVLQKARLAAQKAELHANEAQLLINEAFTMFGTTAPAVIAQPAASPQPQAPAKEVASKTDTVKTSAGATPTSTKTAKKDDRGKFMTIKAGEAIPEDLKFNAQIGTLAEVHDKDGKLEFIGEVLKLKYYEKKRHLMYLDIKPEGGKTKMVPNARVKAC